MKTLPHALPALLLLLAASSAEAGEKVQHSFQSSVSRGAVRRVLVDIPAGEISIRNSTNERINVRGVASREPDGPDSRAEEQRIVDHASVEIEVKGGEAVVRRKFGPRAQGFRAETFTSFDVTVEVPRGMAVDVAARFGEVEIDGSFGDVDVDLRAGEIDLRMPRNDVRELRASCRVGEVRTNTGSEIIEREGLFPGRTRFINPNGRSYVHLHTTAGEINVHLTP